MGLISNWMHRMWVKMAQKATKAEMEACIDFFRKTRVNAGKSETFSPLSTADIALVLAHHSDPAVRVLAARALGESKADGVEVALAQAAGDAAASVRAAAIKALSSLSRGDITRVLLPLLQDEDEDVRVAAAAGLKAGGPDCVPPLVAALADPAGPVRYNALSSLGSLARFADAGLVDHVLRALQAEQADYIRRRSAETLAAMHASQAAAYLLGTVSQLLNQPGTPTEMRRVAADVLGRIGRQECVAPLLAALSDPDESVRYTVLEALGKVTGFADAAMIDDLTRVLRTESDKDVRLAALSAMNKLRGTPMAARVAENLTRLLSAGQETEDARVAAIFVLAEVGGATSLPLLDSLATDPMERIRAATASGLGQIKGEESLSLLRRLVSDHSATVREAALRSLKSHNIPLCRRCGAVAEHLFGFTQEPVCRSCYSKPGVCQSCGRLVGVGNLIKISAGNNCRECDAKLDQMVSGGFRTTTRIR